MSAWMQVQTFYNGLLSNTQAMVDAASESAINNNTPEEAYDLIEVMASNNYMKPSDRNFPRKAVGVHEEDAFTALSAQLATVKKQLGSLNVNSILQHGGIILIFLGVTTMFKIHLSGFKLKRRNQF